MLVHSRHDDSPDLRVGYTVTKKIGNAVIRNRLKRRLRALARQTLVDTNLEGRDIVMIGRHTGLTRSFAHMHSDMEKAIAYHQKAAR